MVWAVYQRSIHGRKKVPSEQLFISEYLVSLLKKEEVWGNAEK